MGGEGFGNALDLYFGGDMEAALALAGQVVGRIESVEPVAQIIARTSAEFGEATTRLTGVVAHG